MAKCDKLNDIVVRLIVTEELPITLAELDNATKAVLKKGAGAPPIVKEC